jgi:hypothetical protein
MRGMPGNRQVAVESRLIPTRPPCTSWVTFVIRAKLLRNARVYENWCGRLGSCSYR